MSKLYRFPDLHLEEEEFQRWIAAAHTDGKSLEEFIRETVRDRISELSKNGPSPE